jgi:hypothetical protein
MTTGVKSRFHSKPFTLFFSHRCRPTINAMVPLKAPVAAIRQQPPGLDN